MNAAAVTVGPVDVQDLDADELQQLWFDVTQAGGAVGLRPPIEIADTRPLVDDLLRRMAAGTRAVVAARATSTSAGPRLVGLVGVDLDGSARRGHRVTLRRLMVDPRAQGGGIGARLVTQAHDLARDRGAEIAIVEVRDGLGLERFYERLGYRECGRIPGGIAFEDGDRVDEVLLVADLRV